MSTILIAFLILVCVLMVLVILALRSEGGALGMGGGPSGFMTARGAGNFLTRATWILAGLFFACAILLIIVGNQERSAKAPIIPPAPLGSSPPSHQTQGQAQAQGQTAPGGGAAGAAASGATTSQPSVPNFGDFETKTAKPAGAPASSTAPAQK
jgi:preprotein translocase subunit SecG